MWPSVKIVISHENHFIIHRLLTDTGQLVHYKQLVSKHIQQVEQTRVCRFCSCRLRRRASRLASLRTNSSSMTDSDKFPAKPESFPSFSSSSATFCCSRFDCSLLFCLLHDLCFNSCGTLCSDGLFFLTAEVSVFRLLASDIISFHLLASSGFFRFAQPPRAQRVMLWQAHEAVTCKMHINSHHIRHIINSSQHLIDP